MSTDRDHGATATEMTGQATPSTAGKGKALVLASVTAVVISVLTMMGGALFGLDTLRGVRGFIGAEGLWSKHQKEATGHLMVYARTGNVDAYQVFLDELGVIQELRRSRLELDRERWDRDVARRGFIGLGVDPRDVPSVLRLYRRFHDYRRVADAIDVWEQGDEKVDELLEVGKQVRVAVEQQPGAKELDRLLDRADTVNNELRSLEDAFSISLAEAADWAHRLIQLALIGLTFAICLLSSGLGVLGVRVVNRTEEATQQIQAESWLKSSRTGLVDLTTRAADEQELFSSMIRYLTPRLDAQVGVLFAPDQDDRFHLRASYAHAVRKDVSTAVEEGEGILGQAIRERQPILLTRVPEDYLCIRSGLGDTTPRNVLVFPVVYQGKVHAVIEVASIDELPDRATELLSLVNKDIALAMIAIEARRVNEQLLEESRASELRLRELNEELQAQQEELRQSNDALEAQQRQLEHVNADLEERGHDLERERQRVLAQNARLDETKRELEEKARELEQASRYKSEFLANMSHELRTPLNSIIVLSGLLAENKDGTLSEKQVSFVRTIGESGNQLVKLIGEILDLSKIEAGRFDLVPEQTPLDDLIAPLEGQFRPVAEEKGLELVVSMANDLPKKLYTDAQRFSQVVRNLLSNALKFTHSGQVQLSVERRSRDELAQGSIPSSAEELLAVVVRDTGIGISHEVHDQVFEAFQQADGSTDRKYGGTGLGLAISRKLARLLGGDILLESEPGEGSCFTFLVPLTAAQAEPTAAEPKMPTEPEPEPATPTPVIEDDRSILQSSDRSLLIIEDDPTFASTLMALGRERDFRCLVAHDGKSGLTLAHQFNPTAVLLDLNLPDLDGMSIMNQLKDDLSTRHIPIHVISGRERLLDTLRAGALGYLRKPVNIGQLDTAFRRIEELVSRPVRRLLIAAESRVSSTIAEALQGSDLQVTTVEQGSEAIAAIRRARVDCAVISESLPDMSGAQVLESIRRGDDNPDTPIVVVCSDEPSNDELTLLHQYADRVITGSHSEERLLDETALFLHRVEKDLPEEQRKVLQKLHDKGAILRGKKLLLVDDDMRNVFALSSVLEAEELEVVIARNGREALERLDEHRDVDLVLMDIMMPEMDGYEAMRRIRDDDRHDKLPIIALTAKAMRNDRARCIEAGANDYLTKPVDTSMLLSMIRVWLYER